MSGTGSSERWKQLHAQSAFLAEAANAVSDRIVDIERRLQALPLKISWSVNGPKGESWRVGFKRSKDGWQLIHHAQDPFESEWVETPLRDANVVIKAQAATVLPQLVSEIVHEAESRERLFLSAIEALDTVDQLLPNPSPEGA